MENVFEHKKRSKFWPKPRKHGFIPKNYHIQKKALMKISYLLLSYQRQNTLPRNRLVCPKNWRAQVSMEWNSAQMNNRYTCKSKSLGPFLLNSAAHPAHLPQKWTKGAKLAVQFSWQLENGFYFFRLPWVPKLHFSLNSLLPKLPKKLDIMIYS